MSSFEKLNTKQNYNIMKKIIALSAILTLGLGFTASAQQKKAVKQTVKTATATLPVSDAEITAAAKKNVNSLSKVVALTDNDKQMYQGLFETKYRMLQQAAKNGNSTAERESVYTSIDAKLRASLNAGQMAKLDAKPAVLKELTH